MSINLKFTEEDWERIERDWTAWWAHELDRPMVILETVNTLYGGREIFTREFMLEQPVDEVIDHYQRLLEGGSFYGDAFPKLFANMGPGLGAGFLGAEVIGMPQERTVWFQAKEQVPIEELHLSYDPDNVWWKRVKDITARAVERWGNKVAVGHTDIGGNLDILASFRTSNQLLLDLYDHPDEVSRLVGEITTAWLKYYEELYDLIMPAGRGTSNWAALWSPKRTYMFQSDFCYMISPRMFEQYVVPDLEVCFAAMDYAAYHLDGKGQIVHLDRFLSMEDLKCIQWIPGAGQPLPDQWPELLKRIIDGGKLCQVYVTAEGARTIVKELGGKGFALYVVNRMTDEEADSFLKVLAREDISLK